MAEGLAELQARLARIPAQVRADVAREVERSAQGLAALARGLAPSETGRLAASIHVEPGAHELQRIVTAGGGAAFYGLYLEVGTAKMKPHQYLNPAKRILRKSIRRKLATAATKAIKAAMR